MHFALTSPVPLHICGDEGDVEVDAPFIVAIRVFPQGDSSYLMSASRASASRASVSFMITLLLGVSITIFLMLISNKNVILYIM